MSFKYNSSFSISKQEHRDPKKLPFSPRELKKTPWKVSKCGDFLYLFFPVFALDTEIYVSPNTGKYGSEKTPYAVEVNWTYMRRSEYVQDIFWMYYQKQPPEMFCKKGVLRNFAKFTEKHLCHRLFFMTAYYVSQHSLTGMKRNVFTLERSFATLKLAKLQKVGLKRQMCCSL